MGEAESEETEAGTPRLDPPRCVAAFTAEVRIGALQVIGDCQYGRRQLFPITGGRVSGSMLRGEVLAGGADWQLVRADGVVELDARYTIRAEDEALIHVRNRGIWHTLGGEPYVRTVAAFEAPIDGPHAALNQSIFLTRLAIVGPDQIAVHFFKVV